MTPPGQAAPPDALSATHRHRLWLAVPLVIVWLAATAFAFWWFELRPLRPFTADRVVVFEGQPLSSQLAALLGGSAAGRGATPVSAATVVHFWDPECACNRFNEAHVRALMAEYGRRGVRFVVLVRGRPGVDEPALIARARATFRDPAVVEVRVVYRERVQPPSSPAVAVMDDAGGLAYFGPYSVGAACGVKNGAFVENTLDGLFRGVRRLRLNMLAVGCFCPWQADSPQPA